jgi:predicted nuclease with TOPRIM domain
MADVKNVGETTVIKFEQTEIDKIQNFKNDYADVTAKLGELEIELIIYEEQKKQIDNYKEQLQQKYLQLRKDEVSLANQLKEKYGEGEFDINSGIFTPKK